MQQRYCIFKVIKLVLISSDFWFCGAGVVYEKVSQRVYGVVVQAVL